MTLANDVKAKLAFQPGDIEQVQLGLVELERALIEWQRISPSYTSETTEAAIEAYWADYLANGLTPDMEKKAMVKAVWR